MEKRPKKCIGCVIGIASHVHICTFFTTGSMLWIIGAVFGALVIIAAIVVGVYCVRTRQNKKASETHSTSGEQGPCQECELYDPVSGYDTVIVADGQNAPEEHPYFTIPPSVYENIELQDTGKING